MKTNVDTKMFKRETMKLAVILLASCAGPSVGNLGNVGSPPPAAKLDLCKMVQAALDIKSESFQRFYSDSCGSSTDARRPVAATIDGVEVTQCQLDRFRIYHEGDSVRGAVLQLRFGRQGDHWRFAGSYFDPPKPEPETGPFDDVNYYCHVIGGYLAQRNGRWHAWQGPFLEGD